MLTKKLAVLVGTALTLTTASAAFAGDYYYRDGYRHHRYHERVVVRPATVYYTPAPVYYEPAPAYYAPAPAYSYYAPAPAYYGPGPATVGGAVIGGLIGNQVASRHNRAAGTVAGALIGGAIGSSIDYRY
jgi:hypothetical protein